LRWGHHHRDAAAFKLRMMTRDRVCEFNTLHHAKKILARRKLVRERKIE
jgi:hypothetical protein